MLSSDDRQRLRNRAREVLDRNWMGASTKPAPDLYPHQWSWDSAFIAIGRTHDRPERAATELLNLFDGQWANGLLPHIVFDPSASGYFPGPDFWETHRSPHAPQAPPTSGIVQPPVHATAAWHVYRNLPDAASRRTFLEQIVPKLAAWHAYLYRERDPDGTGLVTIRHPWEPGLDNSPQWDAILARMHLAPDAIPDYERVDTSIVAADERPTRAEYDRYAWLVRLFAEDDYDDAAIREACPFRVQGVLFNALLVQSGRDLAAMAREIGQDGDRFEAQADRTAQAMNARLWDDAVGRYVAWDVVADRAVDPLVSAGFTPLFAGVPDADRADRCVTTMRRHGFLDVDVAVPTYAPRAFGFDPARYWRGPVWINLNWILRHGLARYGYDDDARRVDASTLRLVRDAGMHEYFDALSGAGHGTDAFSWTAALVLDLLADA